MADDATVDTSLRNGGEIHQHFAAGADHATGNAHLKAIGATEAAKTRCWDREAKVRVLA